MALAPIKEDSQLNQLWILKEWGNMGGTAFKCSLSVYPNTWQMGSLGPASVAILSISFYFLSKIAEKAGRSKHNSINLIFVK